MEKVYMPQNVYDAFLDRLDFIFSEFENILISFSGGKDSGVLYHLVIKYMQDHNITRRIGLFHQDFEAQYKKTTEFVTRVFDTAPDFIDPFWVCLPMGCKTSLSNFDLYWYPWDPDKKDLWVRPLPESRKGLITLENPPDFYEYKMLQEDLYKRFGRWYKNQCGGGKTVVLLGLRAVESLHRYSGIVNKRHDYNGQKWITATYKDLWSASPLYDWETEDIWIANSRFSFDYNQLYDLFYKAGVSLHDMRVASPFNEWAGQSLNLYRVIEPETWTRLVGRIQGANFGAIYGATKALGYRDITLPAGHTWQSYTKFLLETLPKKVREQYLQKFNFSMDFWKKTGGGFAPEVISEIEERGYVIRRNGISNYSKDKKERIVFEQEIPDETDDVKSTTDIPSWKRMCFCILKNDHLCRFMGFGPTKQEKEKIDAIRQKYAGVIRGKS